jgi:23S rRNA (adenine2030-N6)-methyltransferase
VLSYQHSYHAGGPADVHKHAALCLLLEHLSTKEKPFTVIDLYAGEGVYDLSGEAAQKLGEFNRGIARIWPERGSPDELRHYFRILGEHNDPRALGAYPGSPMVARSFLREGDSLILNELHPSAYRKLRQWCADDTRISVHKRDGMEALLGLVPPQIRRGLVFIDPSYEVKTEYDDLPRQISKAIKKWPQGIYALWYPILSEGRHKLLIDGVMSCADTSIFKSEIEFSQTTDYHEDDPPGLLGSGLIVFNPPWRFDAAITVAGNWLATAITESPSKHTASWLIRSDAPH